MVADGLGAMGEITVPGDKGLVGACVRRAPIEQRAAIGEIVFDAADGGCRAELLGCDTQQRNGSLLMLKIKYLTGRRSVNPADRYMTRSSKYIRLAAQ